MVVVTRESGCPPAGTRSSKHQYTYDAAERLLQVDSGSPGWQPNSAFPEFRLQKQFQFAIANDGDNKKKGKLEQATRVNYAACQGTACFGSIRAAVRAAKGTAATTWSSILPSGVPAPGLGVRIDREHLLSLRSAMNSARTALGFAALSYSDSTLSGVPIRIVHQTEIRGGVQ